MGAVVISWCKVAPQNRKVHHSSTAGIIDIFPTIILHSVFVHQFQNMILSRLETIWIISNYHSVYGEFTNKYLASSHSSWVIRDYLLVAHVTCDIVLDIDAVGANFCCYSPQSTSIRRALINYLEKFYLPADASPRHGGTNRSKLLRS